VGLALVSPFVFANSGRAAITDREVNGRPTIRAQIESPADVWMSDSGPVADRRLLQVHTDVFPALHLGQQAQLRPLLELDMGDCLPADDVDGWRLVGQHWGEALVRDLERKQRMHDEQSAELRAALALAHTILAQDGDINWITLKQYRDSADTRKACYQAIVHTVRRITAIHDLREIDARLHVRLHRYPGLPIADTLGLLVKQCDSRGGSVVQDLQPIRPFWMRAAMEEDLGRVLCWRDEERDWTASHPWLANPDPEPSADDDKPGLLGEGCTSVGEALCDIGGDLPLKEQVADWLHDTLTEELAAVIGAVHKLPEAEQVELDATARKRTWSSAPTLAGVTTARGVANGLSNPRLLRYVDVWRELLGERLGPLGENGGRLSRADARAALDRLGEVQVVLEQILSEGWEHGEVARRIKGVETDAPHLRIRADSVGRAAKALRKRHPRLAPCGDDWWCLAPAK
jgi:hypothetical protein